MPTNYIQQTDTLTGLANEVLPGETFISTIQWILGGSTALGIVVLSIALILLVVSRRKLRSDRDEVARLPKLASWPMKKFAPLPRVLVIIALIVIIGTVVVANTEACSPNNFNVASIVTISLAVTLLLVAGAVAYANYRSQVVERSALISARAGGTNLEALQYASAMELRKRFATSVAWWTGIIIMVLLVLSQLLTFISPVECQYLTA